MNLNATSTPTMLLLSGCKRRASLWYCHLIKFSSSKGLTCNQQEKNVRILKMLEWTWWLEEINKNEKEYSLGGFHTNPHHC